MGRRGLVSAGLLGAAGRPVVGDQHRHPRQIREGILDTGRSGPGRRVDIAAISQAIDEAKAYGEGPVMIIAETVKGKGVSFMEGKNTWHGKAISDSDYEKAMLELKGGK